MNTKKFEEKLDSDKYAAVIFLAVSFVFVLPVYDNIGYLGMRDADSFELYHAVPEKTILNFKQMPLWDPFECGGKPLLADPQSLFLSPAFLINLVFGTIIGIKIKIFAYLMVGLHGMFRLSKHLKMKGAAAYLPSFVYMLSSVYPLHITDGMLWILPMAYVPWTILFYLKAKDIRYVILAAIPLSLMLLEAAVYLFMQTIVFMALYSAVSDLQEKRIRKTKITMAIVLITLMLCAIKILPAIDFIGVYPHELKDYSGFSVNTLVHAMLDRDQMLLSDRYLSSRTGLLSGISWSWSENGMYIGFIPATLYILGLFTLKREHRPLAITSLIFLWLSLGHRAPLSLYGPLRVLPLFRSLRIATRYRFLFLFALSLVAGLTVQKITDKEKIVGKTFRRAYALFLLVTAASLLGVLFFLFGKNLVFELGERVYYLGEHAHDFDYFSHYVEIIYGKIVLNLGILTLLSFSAAALLYSRLLGKVSLRRFKILLAYGITVIVLADLVSVDSPIFEQAFNFPPFEAREGRFVQTWNITTKNDYSSEYFRLGEFYQKMKGNTSFRSTLSHMSHSSMYPNFLKNQGSITCGNPMGVRIYALPVESDRYRGEAYLLGGSGGAGITFFSPNRVVVEFNASRSDHVVLNQNYFKGWKVMGLGSGRVQPKGGLVSAEVRPAEHTAVFYYLPDSFILGAFISVLSAGACAIVLLSQKNRETSA